MNRTTGLMLVMWLAVTCTLQGGQAAQTVAPRQSGLAPGKKIDAPVHFFLTEDESGRCTVLKYDGVASLKVHNHIRWDLENECGGTRTIEFRNFRKLAQGAIDCATGPSTSGQPGEGSVKDSFRFKGKIRLKLGDASEGRWCFDVHLDESDTPIDPMVRIDR